MNKLIVFIVAIIAISTTNVEANNFGNVPNTNMFASPCQIETIEYFRTDSPVDKSAQSTYSEVMGLSVNIPQTIVIKMFSGKVNSFQAPNEQEASATVNEISEWINQASCK
ncbi:hypothetical protein [Terasakiella pusilla]|uniref:hypothetical protein n=1 Tax=Terasakiella pusilla TaxID=64973 RepID=UPI003AA910DB